MNKETATLRSQISDLKQKLHIRSEDYEEKQQQSKRAIERLQMTIEEMHDAHRRDLEKAEANYKQKVAELEHEMHRQRERTIALIAEKDHEVEILKADSTPRYVLSQDTDKQCDSVEDSSGVEGLAVLKLEGPLLHFSQEIARRDVEISTLRKSKHVLEQALRELQHSSLSKEERNQEEIQELKEKVSSFERSRSRENANLEYLKNVVYSFVLNTDPADKKHMLNAIATVLEFSSREREAAQHALSLGWWASTAGAKSPSGKR